MKAITIDQIEDIFADRRPGAVGKYKFFSVLVPLVEKDGEIHLLYEVRADDLRRQPGEVCFPGGEVEGSETAQQCALRETVEELSITYADIRVINRIDTVYTYSNFTMYCYLGVIDYNAYEKCKPNLEEVKNIFLVPLKWLLDHEPYIYYMDIIPKIGKDFPYNLVNFNIGYNWRKGKSEVPIYRFEENVIWGLTGRITHNLVKILRSKMDE